MYPIYRVTKFERRTRRVVDTLAEGLTMGGASNLARELRAADIANEDVFGYGVSAMPLHRQAQILAAGETIRTLAA